MIMIRKLKKCIIDIKNSKYFNRFGISPRKIVHKDVQKCIQKADILYHTNNFTIGIDRSINKVELMIESKLYKARANVSVLKWKALMMKGSALLDSEISKTFQNSAQHNLELNNHNYFNQNCDKIDESKDYSEIDPFDEASINREIMRKRFGLILK